MAKARKEKGKLLSAIKNLLVIASSGGGISTKKTT